MICELHLYFKCTEGDLTLHTYFVDISMNVFIYISCLFSFQRKYKA